MLNENLELVRKRIAQACVRCGRAPNSVTLVGITKGVQGEVIREAAARGLHDIGENRVQEARLKHAQLETEISGLRWHMVGHLQRNKAKDAATLFQVIHSLDSRELAEELERQAAKYRVQPIEVFVQVNVSGEVTKFGCRKDEVLKLAEAVLQLSHLRLSGLMTLAPFSQDPEASRPSFRRLRELRDNLSSSLTPGRMPLKLSMGMSQDFEVAIEEGADIIRVGTAIFGPRAE